MKPFTFNKPPGLGYLLSYSQRQCTSMSFCDVRCPAIKLFWNCVIHLPCDHSVDIYQLTHNLLSAFTCSSQAYSSLLNEVVVGCWVALWGYCPDVTWVTPYLPFRMRHCILHSSRNSRRAFIPLPTVLSCPSPSPLLTGDKGSVVSSMAGWQ